MGKSHGGGLGKIWKEVIGESMHIVIKEILKFLKRQEV